MTTFSTLDGEAPIVIGHRGASGYRPEHTVESYRLAIQQGADFVEPDLVATRDGVLVARHENVLASVALDDAGGIVRDDTGNPVVTQETSDVADHPEFADRLTVKEIDGAPVAGWFTEDFTLAEIKTLSARERIPDVRDANTNYNDQFEIPTLAEVIQLVKAVEAETGKKIGIYPETKHPTYFAEEGKHLDGTPIHVDLGKVLVQTLIAEGFTDPGRVFIQSFEVQNLIELQEHLDNLAASSGNTDLDDLPLVQLYGSFDDPAAGGFDQPYDIRYNVENGADIGAIYGETFVESVEAANNGEQITAETGYGDLSHPQVLEAIANLYAEGIGPWVNTIVPRDDAGASQDPTSLVEDAHAAGLQVHPYTFRVENQFLPSELRDDGSPVDPNADGLALQLKQLIALGVDGFFTDNPDIGRNTVDSVQFGDAARTIDSIEFIGEATFATGTAFAGTEIGGLSGMTYDAARGVYYVLSDDRSQINDARFYTTTIDLGDGHLDEGDVQFTGVTTLKQADGTPFPAGSIDPEGIALTSRDTLYIASEGDASQVIGPFVNEFALDGRQIAELEVDGKFEPNPNGFEGIRNNLAFESLTITPNDNTLYTATENALYQDGPAASLDEGSPTRIVEYDARSGEAKAEYVYMTGAVPQEPVPADAFATNGLVELLAVDNFGTLLAMDRAFSTGVGNDVRFYEVRTAPAKDVTDINALDGNASGYAAPKELVLDLATLGVDLDNLEAMAWGPQLADGRQSLIVASDNNFSGTQFTQFLAFAVELGDPPMMRGLQTESTDYSVEALFTVGSEIAGYTPIGLLDGIGAYALDSDTVRFTVNHEASNSDDTAAYSVSDGKGGAVELHFARVSYFDVNTGTMAIEDAGLAYDRIYDRRGELMTDPSQFNIEGADEVNYNADRGEWGFNRFCSGGVFEDGMFESGSGVVETVHFMGEEVDGGTEWALDVDANDVWAVPMFGRGAWENVTQIDTGTADTVGFILGDDRSGRNDAAESDGAPLYLYVGTKDAVGDGSFLDRNGLKEGKLHVWVADDPAITGPDAFNGHGSEAPGHWAEIDNYRPDLAGTDGYDVDGYATQAKLDQMTVEAGAFSLSRPEDVATNPEHGSEFVIASTGREGTFDDADTWGTTYTMDVAFDDAANPSGGVLKIVYDGDQDLARTLRSPDNLDWADDGHIYVQEDRANGVFAEQANKNEASIVRLDPDVVGGDPVRIAEMDRSVVLPAGSTDSDPDDIGEWESSGILDVSKLFGKEPGELFIFDVEAHSVEDGPIAEQHLVEGGQLAWLWANPLAEELPSDAAGISVGEALVA